MTDTQHTAHPNVHLVFQPYLQVITTLAEKPERIRIGEDEFHLWYLK